MMLTAGFSVRGNYVVLKKCNMWQPLGPHACSGLLLHLSLGLLTVVQFVK